MGFQTPGVSSRMLRPGQRDFRRQRRAVGVVGTSFIRRTETDDGFAHQQGQFVGDRARFFYRAFNRSAS